MTGSVRGRFVALYALRMRILPPGTSTLPVRAMRSQHAKFSDMADSCWSMARPHWMAAGFAVA